MKVRDDAQRRSSTALMCVCLIGPVVPSSSESASQSGTGPSLGRTPPFSTMPLPAPPTQKGQGPDIPPQSYRDSAEERGLLSAFGHRPPYVDHEGASSQPQSTGKFTPVIADARSDNRNTTASATSSG